MTIDEWKQDSNDVATATMLMMNVDDVGVSDIDELLAANELARITPSHAEAMRMADRMPPAPEWYEGSE